MSVSIGGVWAAVWAQLEGEHSSPGELLFSLPYPSAASGAIALCPRSSDSAII
ncbi:MAG TPA: hypothetical protein IGS37_16835 [Synechococcales cyanobacterium M55_K2018_004]|nr:hypothetical protein [Synechococcales cyanobacterium M55_K2018_004]